MTDEMIKSLFDSYEIENEKFMKGNKLAGTRARKALSEICKLEKVRRKEIQDSNNSYK